MKTFKVSGTVTVSCWTTVEAESALEALKIARRRSVADIHIDGTYEDSEFFHIANDGEPCSLSAEEET